MFRFKHFSVENSCAALKVGTDAVVLGASMTVGPSERSALDIGTGTGIIALMYAQRNPLAKVDAVEIDPQAAAEAQRNFAAAPWHPEVHCRALQDFTDGGPYDHIFSNPPYYDSSLRNPEERKALARHTVSLSPADICAYAAGHLTGDGILSLILPSDLRTALLRTAASFGLHPFRILSVRTTEAKEPRRTVAEFSFRRGPVLEDGLVLQDGNGRSEEFSALTADFYL